MYNRRSYFRGGRVNYGLGGALLKVGSNLAQGKGFGSGALQGVGKAAITPGSAIGAGAELAGGLLQKSDNPLAQKIGKGLDVASNFAPGGGGIKGAVGDVAGMIGQNQAAGAGPGAAGAAGAAGAVGNALGGVAGQLAQNFLGQARGGKVRLIKAEGGVNTGAAGQEPPMTESELYRQEMQAQRERERELGGKGNMTGNRQLEVDRGVDPNASSLTGMVDTSTPYTGRKYSMADMNQISRGVYGQDVDYDRLKASLPLASSRHLPSLKNILANQSTMGNDINQQAAGGYVSMEDGGTGDPTKDLIAALKAATGGYEPDSKKKEPRDFSDLNELQQSRSDRESAFGTSSTDVYMPVGDIPELPQRQEEETEEPPSPDDIEPIRKLGIKLIKTPGPDLQIREGKTTIPMPLKDEVGYVADYRMRTGQVPTMIRYLDPVTKKVEERPMEPEEIADWMFRNQIRKRVAGEMKPREFWMERAKGLSRAPGAR